jgi:DNA phosphorothioation-associated putative methyltransferase
MQLPAYQQTLEALGFGKRLPGAVYIVRTSPEYLPPALHELLRRAEIAAEPDPFWNLLKLHSDQLAITFLTYPNFDEDPHPVLAEATKINVNTGSVVRTDFRPRSNPPILHRKETFLPTDDPRYAKFAELTRQEENAGLLRDGARIGLRLYWQTLLKRHHYRFEGHQLVSIKATGEASAGVEVAEVQRHRTAIKRYDLSRPVKLLLERGLLRKKDAFFDYGCGHGMDIEALQNLGYQARGWDPAFCPQAVKEKAAVVNLGYVLNVIEDPEERIAALRGAYALAERLLIVSTMAAGQETDAHSRPFRDGFLTKANTFQKFYLPGQLEDLIEKSLDAEACTLSLGICVVFRDPEEAELFEASRTRRRLDWSQISAQLKFSAPAARERRNVNCYALHKELFDRFWSCLLELGRLPEDGEFDELAKLKKAAGSLQKAFSLVLSQHGEALWQLARKARTEDLLVYLAMSKFRPRFLRREIPLRIKHDLKAFFGDYREAEKQARELLYAAGDYGEIALACEEVKEGWQDSDALIIHRSLFDQLPALLRIYVLCAAQRYGDPREADLIKIHKASGKVTFQHYDDFEGKPLPALQTRIKVNLRNLFVEVFDHARGPKFQILYFKERFVSKTHPCREGMEKFSAKLSKLGLEAATIGLGPDKESFHALLQRLGLNENLNPVRKRRA